MVDQRDEIGQDEAETPQTQVEIPLGIVIARILIVSGMGIAGALAIFFLVGGIWTPAIVSFVATVLFMALMFAVEKLAE